MIRFARPIAALLCIALLVVRIGGVHLHLCFDGQEPTASIHLMDAGGAGEHAPAGSEHHQDANIDPSDDGISKLPKFDLSLLALILSAALLAFLGRPQQPAPSPVRVAARAAPAFLRPPFRGPPLISVR